MKDTRGRFSCVTAEYDNQGNKLNSEVYYDAFGNVMIGEIKDSFGYCGEYRDDESGLIYLRNRYYDSATGRFITEDPAKDGVNWYSYCAGNPVIMVDPWGLFSVIFTATIMSDQAEIRKDYYQNKYQTTCLVYEVDSAKDFKEEWNKFFL